MKHAKLQFNVLALSLLTASTAFATDGYFSHGYGVRTQATGGAGIALAQDSLAAASNPAGIAWTGNRIDGGLSWFSPSRSTDITGNGVPGVNGSYEGNDKKNFWLPELGYTRQLNQDVSVGIAAYGNGGMNTDYGKNPYAGFGSKGSAGVNLEQLFISPSLAYKVNDQHAFGAAINFAYQRFSAKGISVFSSASIDSKNLTDNGNDSSTGWGLRLGWSGQITPALTLGATWASKVKTGNFEKYRGLFAQGGGFDIPENYGIGLAYKVHPQLTLAADLQQIKYGDISSIANPLANLFAGNPLGSEKGAGFGWRDITVVKVEQSMITAGSDPACWLQSWRPACTCQRNFFQYSRTGSAGSSDAGRYIQSGEWRRVEFFIYTWFQKDRQWQ
jgi:long-chain fatty acid transport protein